MHYSLRQPVHSSPLDTSACHARRSTPLDSFHTRGQQASHRKVQSPASAKGMRVPVRNFRSRPPSTSDAAAAPANVLDRHHGADRSAVSDHAHGDQALSRPGQSGGGQCDTVSLTPLTQVSTRPERANLPTHRLRAPKAPRQSSLSPDHPSSPSWVRSRRPPRPVVRPTQPRKQPPRGLDTSHSPGPHQSLQLKSETIKPHRRSTTQIPTAETQRKAGISSPTQMPTLPPRKSMPCPTHHYLKPPERVCDKARPPR
jgi:hypothetical protein